MANNKQAIFLMGPTAAGKTDLAVEIAANLPVDIISVDSAMVYRGMDIGTGKPAAEILAKTPHALVDILDPIEAYSAGKFCTDAYAEMCQSIAHGRIPLLVGGTMMYFWALQHGLAELPAADQKLRAQITQEAKEHGWPALHAKLKALDPKAAAKIKENDSQRIQRALEVITVSAKPLSQYSANKSLINDWQVKVFKLIPEERSYLHKLIEQRFLHMLKQGLIEEVEKLFKRSDLHLGLPAMRAVGYRQVWEYLQNNSSKEQMVDKAVAATRQLAKRQFTWLRRWNSAETLVIGQGEDLWKRFEVL